jgi:hypothetical protein
VKPEPFTVRVKACPPACAADGLMPLMTKVGGAAVIVKVAPLDDAPFVLTKMVAVPGEAIREEPTVPVN